MKRTQVYVLYNPLTDGWVTPTWTSDPFVSMCTGFIESDVPFFTNLDAWRMLKEIDAPGIELIELRVAEVLLQSERRLVSIDGLLEECYIALRSWQIRTGKETGDPALDLLMQRTEELIERIVVNAHLPRI